MDEATNARTLGNALPVVGVAVISQLATPVIASSVFALTIALFAIVALSFRGRYAEHFGRASGDR